MRDMRSIRMNRPLPCSFPWAFWPSAPCSRASSFRMISSARARGRILERRPVSRAGQSHSRSPRRHSGFAKQLPTLLMVFGFLVAVLFYVLAPSIPPRLAQVARPLYELLLNKWYFDELYDMIFVRPAFWLGRLFWKGGDGAIIDRLGPDGVAARVVDMTGRVVKLQSGYIYHYAFAMLVGLAAVITWYVAAGSSLMFGFGILSCIVFLPLAGAGFILALRGDDEATLENARRAALGTTLSSFCCRFMPMRGSILPPPLFNSSRRKAGSAHGLVYKMGVDGISFPFVLLTTFLMPICILASWQSITESRQGIYDHLPCSRDPDDRRFLLPRSLALLSFLRGRPHPDVSHHRNLGGTRDGSTRVSNSFSIRSPVAADAACDHGDVWRGRNNRHHRLAAYTTSLRRCRNGCGSRSLPRSPSRRRCGRSIPGFPTRMLKPQRRVR